MNQISCRLQVKVDIAVGYLHGGNDFIRNLNNPTLLQPLQRFHYKAICQECTHTHISLANAECS